jgi:pimeloyl-ACP methyl ester carboxylesterase
MLNGNDSFQQEICRDVSLYRQGGLVALNQEDIVMVEHAGHGLPFEQPKVVAKHLYNFLFN